jgi:hypothetical protein
MSTNDKIFGSDKITDKVKNAIDYATQYGFIHYELGEPFDNTQYKVQQGDIEALARTITSEASYGLGGRIGGIYEQEAIAIGWTILNRVKAKLKKGINKEGLVKAVVTGNKDFGPLKENGKVVRPYHTVKKPSEGALELASRMLNGEVGDPTHGACYFWHSKVSEDGKPVLWGSPWSKARGKGMAITLQLPSASKDQMLYVYDQIKNLED